MTHLHNLWALGQKVLDPGTDLGGVVLGAQLLSTINPNIRMLGLMVLNVELQSND